MRSRGSGRGSTSSVSGLVLRSVDIRRIACLDEHLAWDEPSWID